jgi:hypothetical protein
MHKANVCLSGILFHRPKVSRKVLLLGFRIDSHAIGGANVFANQLSTPRRDLTRECI